MVTVQVEGSPVQLQPDSNVQVAEQPSRVSELLSSQASEPLTSPSGQIVVQIEEVPVQLHPDSSTQVLEHPSKLVVSPSSQPSVDSI